jgi:hypothetical protein
MHGIFFYFMHCICVGIFLDSVLIRSRVISYSFLKGDFLVFFLYVLYSTLLHLPPIHCLGGCWDRTQDCCDFGIDSQTL